MMTDDVGGESSGLTNEKRRISKEEETSLGESELMRQNENPQQDSEEKGGVNRVRPLLSMRPDEEFVRDDEGVDSNAFSGFNSADGDVSGDRDGQSKEDQPEAGGEDTLDGTSKSISSSAPSNAIPSKPKFTSRNLNATLKPMLGSSQKEKTVTKFTESGKVGGRLVVLAHKRSGEDTSPLTSATEAPTIAPLSSAGGGLTRMDSLEGKSRTQTSDSSCVVNPTSGFGTGNVDSTGGTAVPSWGSRVETNDRRSLEPSSKKMAWGAAVMGKKEEKQVLDGGVESGVHHRQRAVHDKRDPYPHPRRADQSHPFEGDFGPAQSPSYSGVNGSMPSSSIDVNRGQQQRPYNNLQGGRRSPSFDRDNAPFAHGGCYMQNGRWGDRSSGGSGRRGGDYQNENQYRNGRHWGHDEGGRDVKDSRYMRAGGGGEGDGNGGWRERGPPMPDADTVMNWRSSPRGFGSRDLGEGRGDRGESNANMQQQQQSRFGAPLVTYRNGGEQGRGGRDGGINSQDSDHHSVPDNKHDQHGLQQQHHRLSPYHGGNDGAAPLSARPDSRSPKINDHMRSKQQGRNSTSPASWEVPTSLDHSSTHTPTSAANDSLGFVLGADPYASPQDVPPFGANSHFPGDNMSLDNPAASGHPLSTKNQGQKNTSSGATMAAGMPLGTQYQHQRGHGRHVGWHSGGGVGHQHMAAHHHQSLQESERSRHGYHPSPGGARGSKSTSILSAGAHSHVGPGKEMGRAMEPSVAPSVPKQLYDPNTNQMVEAPRKRTHDLGPPPSHSRPQQASEQQSNAATSLTKKHQQQSHGAAVPESPSAILQWRSPASIMRREQHKEKERSDSSTGMEPPSTPHGDHHPPIHANEASATSLVDVKCDKIPGLAGGASVTALNSSNKKGESVIMHSGGTNHKGGEVSRVVGKKGSSVAESREQQSRKGGSSQLQLMTRGQKVEQIIHKPLAQQRSNGVGNESKTTTTEAMRDDETEVQRRRAKRAQERRLRPPRTSGFLFTRGSDGSLKCVDDLDTILSRSKEVYPLLVSWKMFPPSLLQKHLPSHGFQSSVPTTTSTPTPRQPGNNPWTKNSESTISKKKAPVHGGSNTTTPLPPPLCKKVESDIFETGWPDVETKKGETGDGESRGSNLLPDVSSLPPKPPVITSSSSSNVGRGSGGVSSRGGDSKRGSKKGWGGGDRRKGGSGEPYRGSDRSSQSHRTQAQAPVLSKGGEGGSTNSRAPPAHESQKDKAPQISSEVSSRGRKPRISRRPNRGGGKAGAHKQVSDRSDSKKDNASGASQPWKGSGAPPSQVSSGNNPT